MAELKGFSLGSVLKESLWLPGGKCSRRAGWKLGGCCSLAGEVVEVGGGSRWRRKAAFALKNTWVVKLTGLSTCQMGRVRELSG